jgi:hypothetical protein
VLLFTGHDGGSTKAAGLHLYASYPQLQIGPLAFAVARVLRYLGPDGGIVTAELVMTATGLFMLYAIERIALTVRPELALRPARLQRVMLAGGAVFMIAWVELAVEFGHLDDVLALAVAGCALGTLAILRRRWAGAVLLAVGARIALDPGAHAYYTAGVMAGALLWDCVGARRPFPLWSLLTLGALTAVPLLSADAALQGRFRLGLVVAFTLAILLMPARWCWQPEADVARQDGATTTPIMPGPV